MKNKIAILALILSSSLAQAGEFKPYLGAYTGFNFLSTDKSDEKDKNGFNLGLKGTGSYITDKFIFDASLGYQFNHMSGGDVTVKTYTLFLDLDARYRLTNQLSLGPTLSNHFNNVGIDNSYSEIENKDNDRFVNTLAGLKVSYDSKIGDYPVRYEAAALTNVNGTDRQNTVVNFGISFTWPESKKTAPVVAKRVESRPRPQVEEVADVKISLKFARVGFQTDAYQLDEQGKARLTKLGKVLATYPQLFERVKISGHTDSRGGKEYNQKLSQDRADSVLKVFVEAGVDEKKMQSVGYGLSRPLDTRENEEAWEKNRRTEIEFFGVKDREFLNKKLEEALK